MFAVQTLIQVQSVAFSSACIVSCPRAPNLLCWQTNQNIKLIAATAFFAVAAHLIFLPTFILPQASVAVFVF